MTSTTAPDLHDYDPPAAGSRGRARARQASRELAYVAGSLPVAAVGFCWVLTLFALGAGTLVTALGLPVLALLLACARGLGAVERGRVARLLGERLPAPAPVRAAGPGFWSRITAGLRDAAGWKAVAYQVVMFPWHVFSFCVSVTFWSVGLALALLPAYTWVYPRYVGWPGLQVADYDDGAGVHHSYYLASFWQVAGACLLGLLLLLLSVRLTHWLTSVSRAAARGLLAG
ncbi:sensor domain-containing protein [Kitasatospora sp. NPDC058965]|uniref:sensor domain-containing protein n=1 Tax=Kitasatospora sp. NPDC058965 TaxID=3346682 RepID=UPI00369AE421